MRLLACTLMIVVFSTILDAQTTVLLGATEDASIDAFSANANKGGQSTLESYPWGVSYSRRFLVNFDLTSIPAGATIVSAKIRLTMSNTGGSQRTINAHLATASWEENLVTWNSFAGQYNTGFVSATVIWPSVTVGEWDVTSNVQSINDGVVVNNGWLFKDNNEADMSQQYWYFYSKESNVGQPELEIIYDNSQTNSLTTISNQSNISCYGETDGTIDLTVSGGTGSGFSYQWTPASIVGQGTSSVSGLVAGSYSVTITDLGDNTINDNFSYTIIEPLAITNSISTVQTTCDNCSDGSFTINPNFGTAPYTYKIENGTSFQNSNVFSGLLEGEYKAITKDAAGCLSDTISIVVPYPEMEINYTVIGTSGSNSDGAIDVTVSKGKAPFVFVWNNGATSEDLSNLGAGQYTLTVHDAGGDMKSVQINVQSQVFWTNLNNATSGVNGSFTNTNANWGLSEGESTSKLSANKDGGVFTQMNSVTDFNHQWTFGLSDANNNVSGIVKYGIRNWTGGGYDIYINNSWYAATGVVSAVGDELKVVREGSVIKFGINNIEIIYNVDPNEELLADFVSNGAGVTLSNASLDFGNSNPVVVETSNLYYSLQPNLQNDYAYVESDKVYFLLDARYVYEMGATLQFKIFDSNRVLVLDQSSVNIQVNYGLNKLAIDVASLSSGIYVLEVINIDGVTEFLTFKK